MKAETMILGAGPNAVFSTDCEKTGLNNNVVVCAGSGCGKTVSILEPRLLYTFDSSLVVTCTKRRIVEKYRDVFQNERGYHVWDLNFADPLSANCSYDPMQYVSSYSDITFLAESIVKSSPKQYGNNSIDPYWEHAAVSLLSALIAYTMLIEKNPTFADVLDKLDSLHIEESGSRIKTTLDSKFERLAQKDPHCFAVTCWESFHVLPIRTAACVFGTLNCTIDTVFSPELRKMISKKATVDFRKLSSEKTVLFITTSAVNPSLHCFVNMFYSQMFKQLFEYAESRPDGKLPRPVHVLCDDFAVGSRILNFPEYISIFREKQISVLLLLQSESQLERMYGTDDTITILDNCDTYIYGGGMNIKTCRHISERLNVPLEDVLTMPQGQEVIFRRGMKPVITQRFDVFRDAEYNRITRAYEKRIRQQQETDRKTERTV